MKSYKLILHVLVLIVGVSNMYAQVPLTTLHNPDVTQNGSLFGDEVRISKDGTTIAVGAPKQNTWSGMVEVYRRDPKEGSNWVQIGQQINSAPDLSQLGSAIAISGNGSRIVVGARETGGCNDIDDGITDDEGYFQVYQYNETLNLWELIPVDLCSVGANRRGTGTSLAITANGDRLAVGSPFSIVDGVYGIGVVDIYDFNPASNSFVYSSSLNPVGSTNESMRFGNSVAMTSDGSVVVVSATHYSSGAGNNEGRIYAFKTENGENYLHSGYKTGSQNNRQFGKIIDIEKVKGDPILLEAYEAYDQIEIFKGVGDPFWSAQVPITIVGPANSSMGISVDINANGDFITGMNPLTFPPSIGAARFYEFLGGNIWQLGGTIEPIGIWSDKLGQAVALSDRIFTCGAFIMAAGAPFINVFGPPEMEEQQPYVLIETNEWCNAILPQKKNDSKGITIYPNPVKTGTISIKGDDQLSYVIIFDELEQKVVEVALNNNSERSLVDLDALRPGSYYLQFYNQKGEFLETKRIIIE